MVRRLFKQVKILPSMKRGKKFLLVQILAEFSKGKTAKEVSDSLSISKQNLNYYIRQLKLKGLLEKKGYGTWEVKKTSKNSTKDAKNLKQIRGHAFIWKIQHKITNWEELLKLKNLKYNYIGIKKTPRIWLNNKKVWLGKKNIIIYESNSFYAENSINSKKYAVYELLETLRELEIKLNINLKPYTFTTGREHYGYIKNDLAVQCNKQGEKIYIRDGKDLWLWIDDSLSLGELENNELVKSKKTQDWFNDLKYSNFPKTSDILKITEGVAKNQVMFDKNFQSHLKLISKLSLAVDELRKEISSLKNN